MFQISEVQESPVFNGRRSFLTLRSTRSIGHGFEVGIAEDFLVLVEVVLGSETLWHFGVPLPEEPCPIAGIPQQVQKHFGDRFRLDSIG